MLDSDTNITGASKQVHWILIPGYILFKLAELHSIEAAFD